MLGASEAKPQVAPLCRSRLAPVFAKSVQGVLSSCKCELFRHFAGRKARAPNNGWGIKSHRRGKMPRTPADRHLSKLTLRFPQTLARAGGICPVPVLGFCREIPGTLPPSMQKLLRGFQNVGPSFLFACFRPVRFVGAPPGAHRGAADFRTDCTRPGQTAALRSGIRPARIRLTRI